MFSSSFNSKAYIFKAIFIISLLSLVLCQTNTIVSSATGITVCFTATHTYVSDLGFYFIGPPSCNSPRITLYPEPTSVCNSGDNVDNLCFSTDSVSNLNVCTNPPFTLSGTYGSSNGMPIDWTSLYGCNSIAPGWRIQIYDCISSDIG